MSAVAGAGAPPAETPAAQTTDVPPNVGPRYTINRRIGAGANGTVWEAVDTRDGKKVAIKHITNALRSDEDAKRTLREVKLLRHFSHKNVNTVLDCILPPGGRAAVTMDTPIVLVFDFMETDLHSIIQSKQALTDEHFQYFLFQILSGLKALHSGKVMHRDLKPANLLVNSNCLLQICDFGLARVDSEEDNMTKYVVTRWYRPPELLLCGPEATYSNAIDIWSVGCIFAEMLMQRPIFPGKHYIEQMKLIFEVLGTDCAQHLQNDSSVSLAEGAPQWLSTLKRIEPLDLAEILPPGTNPLAVDLLSKLLTFDPDARPSVDEVLKHSYLTAFHNAPHEFVPEASWDEHYFENMELDLLSLAGLLFDEMDRLHQK
jgi:serine/threonine protein kinase